MKSFYFLACFLAAAITCQATPQQEIDLFYKKLNFITLLSTRAERDKIANRKDATPLFASDPRLSLVEKYLDQIADIPLDPRSTTVGKDEKSRWKNPTLEVYMAFVYRIVSVEKRGDSYFVRLDSIMSDDMYSRASRKGYKKNIPDLSAIPPIINNLGNWKETVMENLDEWKKNGETWQHWRVGSSFKTPGKQIPIPK